MRKISLNKLLFKSFFISIAILIVIILSVWLYFDVYSFRKGSINRIKLTVLNEKKIYLKTIVNTITNHIHYQSDSVEKRLTYQLEQETNKAYNIASFLFVKYKDSEPRAKLEKLIIDVIRSIRYNKGMGYFFAFDTKGNEKLFADKPEFEGKNLLNLKDAKGNYVLKNMIKIAKENGQGFYTYYWTKPFNKKLQFIYKKKAFIKYFKPLDLIIGTGLYFDDVETKVKKDVKNYIKQFRFGKNLTNNIFLFKIIKQKNNLKFFHITELNSISISPEKVFSLKTRDLKGKFLIKEMVDKCLKNGEDFEDYYFKNLNSNKIFQKISYVKFYPKWNWIIGASVDIDDINEIASRQEKAITGLINKKLSITFIILLITFLFALYIFKKFNKKTEMELKKFFDALNKKDFNSLQFEINEFSALAENIKKFTTKIEEQNEILEAYYNKPKIANFVVNEDGYFDIVNKAFEEITEYLEEEIKKIKFFKIIHPDFRELVKERGAKRLKGEEVLPEYDIKIITKTGKVKWVKLINSHIHLITENKNILLGSAIDITAQKELMEKLNEQYNLFKTLIDSLNIPIWVFDTEKDIFKFKMANKYFYEFFEIQENIIGKEPQNIFPETIYVKAIESNKEIIEKKEKVIIENSVKLKKGLRKILINKSPIFNNNGEIIGIVGVGIDITNKLKMERLKNLESLGVLAGGIAHDFNNILAAIMGNINLLQLYIKDNKSTKILNSFEKSVGRAQKLTKKLLTFSKGGFLTKESTNIVEIVEEVAEFVTTGTSIKVIYNIDENIPSIMIDKEQISEVIHNIILNARQSMEKSRGKFLYVTISKKLEKDFINELNPGKYVEIVIKDTGEGISSDILEHIFDPYFTTKQTGSGLGLATSYSVIKQHGGLITVDSTEQKGSKFTIYIPIITDNKNSLIKKDFGESDLHTESKDKLHVLILEDEEEIRDVLSEILQVLGHNVKFAVNGEEAIGIFKKEDFDLVITDLTIKGGMGGVETARKIREIRQNIYIIASTGYTDSKVAEKYFEYGFDNILLKPYKINEIKNVLKRKN